MAIYTYDDGSTLSTYQTPSGWVTTSTVATDSGIGAWTQDAAEQAKYGQFYPKNGQSIDWNAAVFGVTKAFDAHFQLKALEAQRASAGGSYAGQNGRTYLTGQQPSGGAMGIPPIVWLAIAGAVLFAVAGD